MPADIVHDTNSFPWAVCNMPYEVALAFHGSASPISASVVASGSLPPGLVLDTATPWTRITGTPFVAGLFIFTVTLTDVAGPSTSPALNIRVVTPGIDDWLYRPAKAAISQTWPGTE